MTEEKAKWQVHLSLWLVGILAATLLVFVIPAAWVAKNAYEAHLVDEEINQIAIVQEDWRTQVDERLAATEASALRLGRILTAALGMPRRDGDDEEFDKLVGPTKDGSRKSRPELYDPQKSAGIWLPPSYPVDSAERSMFLTAKQILEAYQTRTAADFTDTWMLPVRGGEVVYWPATPNFLADLAPDTDFTQTEWVTLVNTKNNPTGAAKWTPTSYDPVAKMWMVSAIAPFYRDGVFAGSVGHDIPLDVFSKMTSKITTIYGTHAHFIRKDGTLLVSSHFQEGIQSSNGKLAIEHAGDPSLIHVVQQLKEKPADRLTSFRNIEADRVFFGAYLAGPEWYLVSSVPRTALLNQVQAAYRRRWIVVLAAMLAILAIPVLAISRLLLPSLGKIVEAVMLIRAGDLNVRFSRDRVRELNHVADALNDMVVALSTSTAERETHLAALAANEQKTREMLEEHMKDEQELRNQLAVIQEQQRTITALSTPIIEVWEDVLALPVIGGFDQQRAAQATQVLLDAITRVQARTAILDLTGVDKVDQATANHLLELVQAVKLIGADVIVTGLRAEVARGLIACGANLSTITTKSTLREAIRVSRKSNKARA